MVSNSNTHLGDFFRSSRKKGVEGLPVLSVTLNYGLVIRDQLDRRTETNLEAGDHLLVRSGDIAYNMMRVWQGALGRATVNGLVSPAYVVLRPTEKIDSCYAEYLFKTSRMIYLFWAYSYGLTKDRLRLYFNDFARIPVEIPELQEQKKIAQILSTWDKAITTTEQLLANSQQQKKALMQQLLTGKQRLLDQNGERFQGEWRECQLSDVVSSLDSGVSVNGVEQDVEASYFVLKTSCVSDGVFSPYESKRVVEEQEITRLKEPLLDDSILISRMNTPALVGANAYVESAPENTYLPDRLWQVKADSNKVLMRWLAFWFSSEKTRTALSDLASGTSGSMKNISKKSVLAMSIRCPTMEEQQKIAAVLSAADQEITTLQQQLDHLKQEKKALMQQLLTGKRRVLI